MVPNETANPEAAGDNPTETPSGAGDGISLRVPCKAEYAMVVRLVASGIASHLDFTHDEIEQIKIAIGEACTNCIQHAYPSKRNGEEIQVRFLPYPSKLVIIVEDFGEGFDAKLVEKYMLRKEREKGEELGIFLMKSLMDELEISSVPGVGTQVRMVKYKEGLSDESSE